MIKHLTYMLRKYHYLLVVLAVILIVLSRVIPEVEKPQRPQITPTSQVAPSEETLCENLKDSTSISHSDTFVALSNEEQVASTEEPKAVKQIETPAVLKPAEPQKETEFYAKGRRRQNWHEMFPLKGDVARVIINETELGCSNYDEYKFNKNGDVVYRKIVCEPQDTPEMWYGGARQEFIYTYNNKGQIVEKVELNWPQIDYGNRTITSYEYNKKGRLVKSEVYTRENTSVSGTIKTYTENIPAHEDNPVPIDTGIKEGDKIVAKLLNAGYKNRVIKRRIYDAEKNLLGRVTIKFDSHGNVVKYIFSDDPAAVGDEDSTIYKFIITYRN